MRVLAHVHKYPPIHNAGAEWMLHAILVDLIARGHECYVTHPNGWAPYELDGVIVFDARRKLLDAARAADVVITHLDRTGPAVAAARSASRPIVHLIHNDRQAAYHHVTPAEDSMLVANSEWIERALAWPARVTIVRPPVDLERYTVPAGRHDRHAVTLVNLTTPKGAGVFYDLARAERDRAFLGVIGAYGAQVVPRRRPNNVEVLSHSADIVNDVYARTRVVLMPSSYESWGRVAIEAAASGIPTIAHPTPGLREALGDAGIFADRRNLNAWRTELARLDDPGYYDERRLAARARAEHLERLVAGDLERFHDELIDLVGERRRANPAAYDGDVGILTAARAARRCPICAKASCACGPSTADLAKGIVIELPGRSREPRDLKTYRTHNGDFRLTETTAAARGLAPADTLVRPVLKRLANEAGLDLDAIEELTDRYEASPVAARSDFHTELALVKPRSLADELPRIAALLDASNPRKAPTPADPDTEVPTGRVGDVLEWADHDRERLTAALETERSGKARSSLLTELERRLKDL